VEHPPHRASALILFDSIEDASSAAAALQARPSAFQPDRERQREIHTTTGEWLSDVAVQGSTAEAAELMDAASMRAGQSSLPEVCLLVCAAAASVC
jgi:hypothetical protein